MTSDIIAVISFIVVIFIVCKVWSIRVIKAYDSNKQNSLGLAFEYFANKIKKMNLSIVGTGTDLNGDYNVSKAIKEVDLSKETRIKLR